MLPPCMFRQHMPGRTILRATHSEGQDLLHTEHPRPPAVLSDTDARRVRDLDRMQRPVWREAQAELELVLVDRVRRRDLVHRARDLDLEILVRKVRGGNGVLGLREFCAYDRWGEVRRRVLCHRRIQLAVAAVGEPGPDETWYEAQCKVVEVRCEERQSQRRVRGGHCNMLRTIGPGVIGEHYSQSR